MLLRKRKDDDLQDIPVIIDTIKNEPEFSMTRCAYFVVTADYLTLSGLKSIPPREAPWLDTGLQLILTRNLSGKHFSHRRQITSLILGIEKHKGYFVDINDIWLPNSLFLNDVYHRRGAVYRVKFNLFKNAFEFSQQRISKEGFEKEALPSMLIYSSGESAAFEAWNQRNISLAFHNFQSNNELALQYSGTSQSKQT